MYLCQITSPCVFRVFQPVWTEPPGHLSARQNPAPASQYCHFRGRNPKPCNAQAFAKWVVFLRRNREYVGFLAVSASEMAISQIPHSHRPFLARSLVHRKSALIPSHLFVRQDIMIDSIRAVERYFFSSCRWRSSESGMFGQPRRLRYRGKTKSI